MLLIKEPGKKQKGCPLTIIYFLCTATNTPKYAYKKNFIWFPGISSIVGTNGAGDHVRNCRNSYGW